MCRDRENSVECVWSKGSEKCKFQTGYRRSYMSVKESTMHAVIKGNQIRMLAEQQQVQS